MPARLSRNGAPPTVQILNLSKRIRYYRGETGSSAEPPRVQTSKRLRKHAIPTGIAAVGTKTAYIEPGSPWESGFNARLRDELLNGELFYTLREAQIVAESWRRHYNTVRPHASSRLQTTSTGGLRACILRVAG